METRGHPPSTHEDSDKVKTIAIWGSNPDRQPNDWHLWQGYQTLFQTDARRHRQCFRDSDKTSDKKHKESSVV
jgi:hypothetical protein